VQLPPGYAKVAGEQLEKSPAAKAKQQELKAKKAWEVAKSPQKSLFMTAFMMWMTGSTIHIFTLMPTAFALFNAVKGMMSVNSVFARFGNMGNALLPQKLLFVFFHCATLAVALYKCWVLGLLPTEADWLAFHHTYEEPEFSSGWVQGK